MDRINHVKLVTPDPKAVDTFLTEVLDIPEGWSLGDYPAPPAGGVVSPARDEKGEFTHESVDKFRGAKGGGLITGNVQSRQFQILTGDTPHIWGIAVGTRHIEDAHKRCEERGFPCTSMGVTPWGEGQLRFFFAEAGGIVFEVLRAEDREA